MKICSPACSKRLSLSLSLSLSHQSALAQLFSFMLVGLGDLVTLGIYFHCFQGCPVYSWQQHACLSTVSPWSFLGPGLKVTSQKTLTCKRMSSDYDLTQTEQWVAVRPDSHIVCDLRPVAGYGLGFSPRHDVPHVRTLSVCPAITRHLHGEIK